MKDNALTCSLLKGSALDNCMNLFRKSKDTTNPLEGDNFTTFQNFINEIKRCPIPGDTFEKLITEYGICVIVGQNPNLTPQQIRVLVDSPAVCDRTILGNEKLMHRLKQNKAAESLLDWLGTKEKEMEATQELAGKKGIV